MLVSWEERLEIVLPPSLATGGARVVLATMSCLCP